MIGEIIFVGGVHGVGKSSMCKAVASSLHIGYLSASSLIDWDSISEGRSKKNVADIRLTQSLLIQSLKKKTSIHDLSILDGHLCLLNQASIVTRIPKSTFDELEPSSIVIVCDEPEFISTRLFERDGVNYSKELIDEMQLEELTFGREMAQEMDIPFLKINSSENDRLCEFIHSFAK